MKKLVITLLCLLLAAAGSRAQVGINTDGSQPDATAILDIKSSNKGFLPPRMTLEERNAIATPAEGLLVFNTTTGCIDYFLGGSWKSLGGVTEPEFRCGMKMTDPRDGRRYNTVKIGARCWMAQNLNTGTAVDGASEQRNNSATEKFCYQNLETNCDVYGGLYQWGEAVNYLNNASNTTTWTPPPAGVVTGICPPGWHLPGYAEWNDLATLLGGYSEAGGKMKETGTSHWSSPNAAADNASGFTARPGGIYAVETGFSLLGLEAWTWSASETYSAGAESYRMSYEAGFLSPENTVKTGGLAVRCVMD